MLYLSILYLLLFFFFFFQAEDGIRDYKVTGVQTCALPISQLTPTRCSRRWLLAKCDDPSSWRCRVRRTSPATEIGRASCRERVDIWVFDAAIEPKNGRKR